MKQNQCDHLNNLTVKEKTKNECHNATARSNINESDNARDDKRRGKDINIKLWRLRRACHKVLYDIK